MESYKIFVEVFKGYLDTALTANIWFYTLTGAIVSYYLSNRNTENKEKSYLKYSLFLPFILGVQIIVLSFLGVGQARLIEQTMLEAAPDIKLKSVPAVEVLVYFLRASIILISLVCLGLMSLYLFLENPFKKWREKFKKWREKKEKKSKLLAILILLAVLIVSSRTKK